MRLWRDLLTGVDGHTYAFARVIGFIYSLAFLLFQGWSIVVHGHEFHPELFGAGATGLLLATGYAVSATSKTEPPHEPPNLGPDI